MIRLALASLMLLPLAACATDVNSAATQAPRAPFASERIGVTVVGSGPDVVLVPGLSSSPRTWQSTVAALPGYRYHIVHVSGFAGRAAGANATGPVVAPVAEEIARYIQEAGLRQPAIVGHSLGGTWAMMVAARHPGIVSRVMVVDMFPFTSAMFSPNATPENVRPIAEQMRAGIARSGSGSADARRAMADRTIASMVRTEALRPIAVEDSMNSDPAVSGQAMYDLVTTDLRPELANVRVPITVLWVRTEGAPMNEEQMAAFYRASFAAAPQARIVHVPNSYHFIMWDQPDVFQRELRTFLSAR